MDKPPVADTSLKKGGGWGRGERTQRDGETHDGVFFFFFFFLFFFV